MLVVRLFVMGWLAVVVLGAGCASQFVVEANGTDGSSEGTTEVDESGTSETGEDEPACGNGVVEAGESCDEGVETATCNVNCTPAQCGDGIVNATRGEQCDAGGATALCDDDCTPVVCGDGLANNVAGEECDGDDLAGGTCEGLGFDVGTLACGAGCSYDVSECYVLPGVPMLQLGFSQVKLFDFSWAAVAGAEYYRLEESVAPGEPFVQLGGDIVGESVSHEMPLHVRWEASYRLWACNVGGCTESAVVDVMGSLVDSVGYVKASNTDSSDYFGVSVALSADGNTLAVGAYGEGSNATGINPGPAAEADDSAPGAGAVYVFTRDGIGTWSQHAYLKASNTDSSDYFGYSVALSADGNTLAVGAFWEDCNATGVNPGPAAEANDSASSAGAVYVFTRDGIGTWSQHAYLKASNTDSSDYFGRSVALSADGNTLAVGAYGEDSNATGVNPGPAAEADDSAPGAGAVYVFTRDGIGTWSQHAYLKASNTDSSDNFGQSVALSADGNTLAVGAHLEGSNATGVDPGPAAEADDSASSAGTVYVFTRDGIGTWSQYAYLKASNTDSSDYFGYSVALSADGNTLAVGAYGEDSNATGINPGPAAEADDSASNAGAVYVFTRHGIGTWSQHAYLKASNTDASDYFGQSVALSADGNTLAVGARYEDSNATGVDPGPAAEVNDSASDAGAVYMFTRHGIGTWSQHAYLKASNTDSFDNFGQSVALSADGHTLAVGARYEDSNATGVDPGPAAEANDSASDAGAVYLY
ncbi:FG-GAP repeat protein [Paraliomyxa miuraensis]|uniref:FG-GAP repeat protein n=1 Tax=Paraliomyxa miuraensis TaxID=376150 RepID=UPI00225448F3|nr:FG-GAP repeat protein [Paraliomyxa miuraensis]MCX4241743.1 FG-GAP repeat protein [Paraliomyxa miuraensis]